MVTAHSLREEWAFVAAVPVAAIVGLIHWLKTSIVSEIRDSKKTWELASSPRDRHGPFKTSHYGRPSRAGHMTNLLGSPTIAP